MLAIALTLLFPAAPRLGNSRLIQMRSCCADAGSGLTCSEPIVGWVGWCGVLVSPDRRLARKLGMRWLGTLLVAVEPVQVVHWHESDQHELPDLANEIPGGTSGIRAGDVAACDCQKVFGFDTADITDMSRRAARLPGSQGVLGQVVAQAGLQEQVGPESFGAHWYGSHEHSWGNIDVAHPSAQRHTHRFGDVRSRQHRRPGRAVGATVMTVGVK